MKDIIAAIMIGLVVCLSVHTAEALSIYNVRIESITENSAIVKWQTDKDSDSTVFYGINRPPSQRKDNASYTKNHSVELTNLMEDRKYFVNALSRTNVESAFDDNRTYSYSFNTLKGAAALEGINISVPTAATLSEIKSAVNTSRITISGITEPGSTVRFFVNSPRIPSQIIETGRYGIDVNETGYFAGTILLYETVYQGIAGLNNITIRMYSADGKETSVSRLVVVDTASPRLFIQPIASPRNNSAVAVAGSVSEQSNVTLNYMGRQETVALTNNTFNKSITFGADGNYTLNITATDNAGNTARQSYNIIIDTRRPSITFNEEPFRQPSRINIITLNGTTSEPRCKITVKNLGDLGARPSYANVTPLESEYLMAQINRTRRPGEQEVLSVEYEVGIAGAIVRYEKEFMSDDNGKFREDLAIVEGNNDLLFTVIDEAGNKNEIMRRVVFEPGSDLWLIDVVTTLPNEIYTDNLRAEGSQGVKISVMYDVLYYGPSDKELTNVRASSALDGTRLNNSFFSVGQSYEYWNRNEKKLFVLTEITAKRYTGSIEDLPDQLNFALRTTLSYRYGNITMTEDVFPISAVAVEKPFDYTRFLSPEMINDTIEMLDDWINWTSEAQNVTEKILFAATAACIAYQIYTYIAGPGENSARLKTMYYLCDRVWCPTIPPDCGRLTYIQDRNVYQSTDRSVQVEWAQGDGRDPQRTCPAGFNRLRITTVTNGTPALGFSGSNTVHIGATEYYCSNVSESNFRGGDANAYSGIGCFPQNDGNQPPEFHNAKCWPSDANTVNDQGKVNTYDDLIMSLRCGCISGTYGHLGNLLRILQGFKKCLQQAYIGEVRGGYCERLFAQFVCDLISWLVQRAMQSSGRGELGPEGTGQASADMARGNFQEVQTRLQARYGGIATNRLGLDPREIVAKMCIAAITGDWSDLRNQITQAARVPVEPVIGPMLPESRFTSWNPFTGRAGINYYLTLGILSGGQRVTGKLKILCDKSRENGNFCPSGQEVIVHEEPIIVEADGSIERNVLYQDDNARYWANVARLELDYEIGGETRHVSKDEIIRQKGGVVAQCHLSLIPCCIQCDVLTGSSFGTMEFMEARTTPNIRTYYPENKVLIAATTQKIAPFGSTNATNAPNVYLVYNLTKPDGKKETNKNDKNKLQDWKIEFNNLETDVFELLTFPRKSDIGLVSEQQWKLDRASLTSTIDLTEGSLVINASAKRNEVWEPRRIINLTFDDMSCYQESNIKKSAQGWTILSDPPKACNIKTFSIAAEAVSGDQEFKVTFEWIGTPGTITQTYTTSALKSVRSSGAAGIQYPTGEYRLGLELWFDKDGNGLIDKEDEPVPFGSQDLQTKTVTFSFSADVSDDCRIEPRIEIIYPKRSWLVTKSLSHVKQGVDVTLWDDCNQIQNVAIYDEKSYKAAQDAARKATPATDEPFAGAALDFETGVSQAKLTLGESLTEEKQGLFRYNNREDFKIIARAIDSQGHKGGAEVLVKFSGEGAAPQSLTEAQCTGRGGQCLQACASSAAIVGACPDLEGQARVCCTQAPTTTSSTTTTTVR
jgi:hypothetical protein